jgi:hypothetical protein
MRVVLGVGACGMRRCAGRGLARPAPARSSRDSRRVDGIPLKDPSLSIRAADRGRGAVPLRCLPQPSGAGHDVLPARCGKWLRQPSQPTAVALDRYRDGRRRHHRSRPQVSIAKLELQRDHANADEQPLKGVATDDTAPPGSTGASTRRSPLGRDRASFPVHAIARTTESERLRKRGVGCQKSVSPANHCHSQE